MAGVLALIVVIAVMSGFGKDLRDKILGATSHIVVTNIDRAAITEYDEVAAQAMRIEGVVAAAPFIMSQVMLTHEGRVSGVVMRGVDPSREATVSDLEKNMVEGSLAALTASVEVSSEGDTMEREGVILGRELTRKLGVELGDVVSMVSPVPRITPVGLIPKMKLLKVAGIFESGMYEYDTSLGFISLSASQKFFSMRGKATGVEIRVDDIEQAAVIAGKLQEKLGFPFYVRDWMRMNKNLFLALKLEKL